jgi:hypothetical protein
MTDEYQRHLCPSCEGAVVDWRQERCIYCGSVLPPELLASRRDSAQAAQPDSTGGALAAGAVLSAGADADDGIADALADGLDLAADVADLTTDAVDLLGDLGDLF